MSFYTNVHRLGNNILFRGISNDGQRFKDRVEYKPTLYIPTKEKLNSVLWKVNQLGKSNLAI